MKSGQGLWNPVGTLSETYRYPVKSLLGLSMEIARVGWHGVSGDRQFALLHQENRSGLPWISAREFPRVVGWLSEHSPRELSVREPTGMVHTADLDIPESEQAFSQSVSASLETRVSLFRLWRGCFDSMALSLITSTTLEDIAELTSASALDVRRYRPNLVIDALTGAEIRELKWLGKELRLGEPPNAPIIRVDRATTRCSVVDLDPDIGVADEEIFAALHSERRNRAGVYCTTVHPGLLHVGTTVYIR